MSELIAPEYLATDLSFTITKTKFVVLRIPCTVPVKTSFGTMHDRPALFLELEDSTGNKGIGEVWCNFPACGAEHRAQLLDTAVLPVLVGQTFESPATCFESLQNQFVRLAIQAGEPGPIAQCIAGIDVALWDLVSRRADLPLYCLLGGSNSTIPAYASGINPNNALQTVHRCRDQGFRAFKLKIGFDHATDLKNVASISASLEPGERFMVDANQSWSLDDAVAVLPDLMEHRLDWLEEPIMANSPAEHWQTLASACTIDLAAGENMINTQDFEHAIAGDWLDVIQPDVCKWGGISALLLVARQIIASGKRYCPHYLGGGVGLAASAHLLAAVGGKGLLEIDSNDNPLRTDIFPSHVTDGMLTLSDEPGLGITQAFDSLVASGIGKENSK